MISNIGLLDGGSGNAHICSRSEAPQVFAQVYNHPYDAHSKGDRDMHIFLRTIIVLASMGALAACGQQENTATPATPAKLEITEASFSCIRDMVDVGRFYVDNLLGDRDGTVAVALSENGGVYPVGSIVQLVPGEAMVKREAGYSAETKDWEFFELDVAADGATIRTRGHKDVVNRFDGNCLDCHIKAEAQWDLICAEDHGCDPIPLTLDMFRALQKTDPRCAPTELTEAEQQALAILSAATGEE